MSLTQGQILQIYSFPCTLLAVKASPAIEVKCASAIFFPVEVYSKTTAELFQQFSTGGTAIKTSLEKSSGVFNFFPE